MGPFPGLRARLPVPEKQMSDFLNWCSIIVVMVGAQDALSDNVGMLC